MGELAKLGEKVKARKPFFSKAKGGKVEEEREASREGRMVQRNSSSSSMLSEDTVFLLMDRFAPC